MNGRHYRASQSVETTTYGVSTSRGPYNFATDSPDPTDGRLVANVDFCAPYSGSPTTGTKLPQDLCPVSMTSSHGSPARKKVPSSHQ